MITAKIGRVTSAGLSIGKEKILTTGRFAVLREEFRSGHTTHVAPTWNKWNESILDFRGI
jgi:hypothetical protein